MMLVPCGLWAMNLTVTYSLNANFLPKFGVPFYRNVGISHTLRSWWRLWIRWLFREGVSLTEVPCLGLFFQPQCITSGEKVMAGPLNERWVLKRLLFCVLRGISEHALLVGRSCLAQWKTEGIVQYGICLIAACFSSLFEWLCVVLVQLILSCRVFVFHSLLVHVLQVIPLACCSWWCSLIRNQFT